MFRSTDAFLLRRRKRARERGGGGEIAEERACMRVDRLRAVPLFQRGNFKPEGVPQKQKKLLF